MLSVLYLVSLCRPSGFTAHSTKNFAKAVSFIYVAFHTTTSAQLEKEWLLSLCAIGTLWNFSSTMNAYASVYFDYFTAYFLYSPFLVSQFCILESSKAIVKLDLCYLFGWMHPTEQIMRKFVLRSYQGHMQRKGILAFQQFTQINTVFRSPDKGRNQFRSTLFVKTLEIQIRTHVSTHRLIFHS